jgi:hypothetical protein
VKRKPGTRATMIKRPLQIHVHVSREEDKKLRELAVLHGQSLSDYVRGWIRRTHHEEIGEVH